MAKYKITIKKSAAKELENIPKKDLRKIVKCCPDWVFKWAEGRRKRREFWRRRGYY